MLHTSKPLVKQKRKKSLTFLVDFHLNPYDAGDLEPHVRARKKSLHKSQLLDTCALKM
jgi:hypothetical protein